MFEVEVMAAHFEPDLLLKVQRSISRFEFHSIQVKSVCGLINIWAFVVLLGR